MTEFETFRKIFAVLVFKSCHILNNNDLKKGIGQ